jgi:hypothetical protein
MSPIRLLVAATLGFAAAAAAPEDRRLDLGRQQGDVYTVKQADGLHVVATFAEPGQATAPVRFETVLAPGQAVTVSSPRGVGEPTEAVTLTRHGDDVEVRKLAEID